MMLLVVRELQSTTNYFLLSLALADLLVCTVVMPFGAATFITGSWSMSTFWCIFYQTCDVLACSVSILHLMFICAQQARPGGGAYPRHSSSEHWTVRPKADDFARERRYGPGMLKF